MLLIFRPVPISKVVEFLAFDKTNTNIYRVGYDCSNFANDLSHNAKFVGIEAHRADILFTNEIGHAIVVFKTIDRGMVAVEPQTDAFYYWFEVGKRLCNIDKSLCIGEEPIRKIIIRD